MERQLEILIVEDNVAAQRLAVEGFKSTLESSRLHIVSDGLEAIDYLRRRGTHSSSLSPDFIILDLNLPLKSGREVLREIKEDPALRRIPVIIFSSSHSERDVSDCYDLHANCYIRKPNDLEEFFQVIKFLERFWGRTVELAAGGNARRAS